MEKQSDRKVLAICVDKAQANTADPPENRYNEGNHAGVLVVCRRRHLCFISEEVACQVKIGKITKLSFLAPRDLQPAARRVRHPRVSSKHTQCYTCLFFYSWKKKGERKRADHQGGEAQTTWHTWQGVQQVWVISKKRCRHLASPGGSPPGQDTCADFFFFFFIS